MKKKKLTLKKETIANLSNDEMNRLNGGGVGDTQIACGDTKSEPNSGGFNNGEVACCKVTPSLTCPPATGGVDTICHWQSFATGCLSQAGKDCMSQTVGLYTC